jgi:hypothetical protein
MLEADLVEGEAWVRLVDWEAVAPALIMEREQLTEPPILVVAVVVVVKVAVEVRADQELSLFATLVFKEEQVEQLHHQVVIRFIDLHHQEHLQLNK